MNDIAFKINERRGKLCRVRAGHLLVDRVVKFLGFCPGSPSWALLTIGIFVLAVWPGRTRAAAGDIDPVDLGVVGRVVYSTAVQPDGKILIGGNFTTVRGALRWNLARLNADATLDAAFDPVVDGSVYAVAIQPDGKLVIAGSFASVQGHGAPAATPRRNVARLNADGSLDPVFDPSPDSGVYAIAIQPDGKVLLGGYFTSLKPNGLLASTSRSRLARVNGSGTLDSAFDPKPDGSVNCLILQPDARIVVGGRFSRLQPNGATVSTTRNSIARLNADGSLDMAFDPNIESFGEIACFSLQPDGKIVMGGSFSALRPNGATSSTYLSNIARLNADGSIDGSFVASFDSKVDTMVLQADGRMVVGGAFATFRLSGTLQTTARRYVARLNADGTLDNSFNPSPNFNVYSVALQPSGAVMLAGDFSTLQPAGESASTKRNLMAVLTNDPARQVLRSAGNEAVKWVREGSAPELSRVSFDVSQDGGVTWTPFGVGMRIGTSSHWQADGVKLPAVGKVRARGVAAGGIRAASSSLIEQVAEIGGSGGVPTIAGASPVTGGAVGGTLVTVVGSGFSSATDVSVGGVPAATFTVINDSVMTLITPPGAVGQATLTIGAAVAGKFDVAGFTYVASPSVTASTKAVRADGSTLTISGTGFSAVAAENNVAFSPAGVGSVTSATPTSLTVTGLAGHGLGPLSAVVTSKGLSSGPPVQVGNVVGLKAGDLDGLDLAITGGAVFTTAEQADGAVIIAGSFTAVGGIGRGRIARIKADGSLDEGFNPGANDIVYSIVVLENGQILIGGSFTSFIGGSGTVNRSRLARLNADGSVDPAFDCKVTGASNVQVSAMALQPDSKVVLAGFFSAVQAAGDPIPTARRNIARIDADGKVDPVFDPNPTGSSVSSVAIQPDGRILLGGTFTALQPPGAPSPIPRQNLARLLPDGSVDLPYDAGVEGGVTCILLQPDGKAIVAGSSFLPHGNGEPVTGERGIRINEVGSLDTSFNLPINGHVESMALQANGALVLGAASFLLSSDGGTSFSRYAARVNAGALLDRGFDPRPNGAVESVSIRSDGRVGLAGVFTGLSPNGSDGIVGRNAYALLLNDPAITNLMVPSTAEVVWERSGTAPELAWVDFQLSTDAGVTWVPLGRGKRVGFTANWHLANLSLPSAGKIRAVGRNVGGWRCGSSGLAAETNDFSGVAPPILQVSSVSPASGPTAGGTLLTLSGFGFAGAAGVSVGGQAATDVNVLNDTTLTARTPVGAEGFVPIVVEKPGASHPLTTFFRYIVPPTVTFAAPRITPQTRHLEITGTGFSANAPENVVVFSPAGSGTVTGATSTTLTVAELTGQSVGPLSAVVVSNGQSSGAPVQIAAVEAPAAGDLDPTFATLKGSPLTAAMLPDGKIMVGGNGGRDLMRLNADGTVDSSFGTDTDSTVLAIVVQSDGKILIGGYFTRVFLNDPSASTQRNYIARINADGSLDTGFNPNANGWVRHIALQPDGKIVVAGAFTTLQPSGAATATARSHVARLNTDGSLDTGFDPNVSGDISTVAIQPDGKILLGGGFTTVRPNGAPSATARPNLARVNADGTLDSLFFPSPSSPVDVLALQPDGAILVSGWFSGFQPGGMGTTVAREHLARLRGDGTVDESFDPNPSVAVETIVVQSDGRILIGGYFTTVQPQGASGPVPRKGIARLEPDGSLDYSFDPRPDSGVASITLASDGTVLMAGSFASVQPNGMPWVTPHRGLARLFNDPAADTLTVASTADVFWNRSGSAPEVSMVFFDLSTDGGSSWLPLGQGSRVGRTSAWQLSGLNLPQGGAIRARGMAPCGSAGGSSSLLTSTVAFSSAQVPTVVLDSISPAIGSTVGGTTVTLMGSGFTGVTEVRFGDRIAQNVRVLDDSTVTAVAPAGDSGLALVFVKKLAGSSRAMAFTYMAPPVVDPSTARLTTVGEPFAIAGRGFSSVAAENSVAFFPAGTGTVTTSTGSRLTIGGLSGLTPGPLHAVVTVNGVSSRLAVQVANVELPRAGDVDNIRYSFSPTDEILAVVEQPDGKVLAAGNFSSVQGISRNNLVRFNADGTVDTTFSAAAGSSVRCVAIQPDGKILIGGVFTTVTPTGAATAVARRRLARLNPDGTLDTAFDPGPADTVTALAIQPNGDVLVGGAFRKLQPGGTSVAIQRLFVANLHSDGTVDETFKPAPNFDVSSIARQPDGKVLLAGRFTMLVPEGTTVGIPHRGIARVHPNGTLDECFNASTDGRVDIVAARPDGKIVLGGFFSHVGASESGFELRNRIAQVDSDGKVDPSFDPNPDGSVISLVGQADGDLLMGGNFSSLRPHGAIVATPRAKLARIHVDGTPDTLFDPGFGVDGFTVVYTLGKRAAGGLVAGGHFSTLQPNGSGWPTVRSGVASLYDAPAFQSVGVLDSGTVVWNRSGSAQELAWCVFDLSRDGGTSWEPLGEGQPGSARAQWKLTGLALPDEGVIRARGIVVGGYNNGSSGVIEQIAICRLSAQSLFDRWANEHGITTDPFAEGGANLLRFAAGMAPRAAGSLDYDGVLSGNGAVGSPGFPVFRSEGADRRALFVRRKDWQEAGLIYTPQFSGDLAEWDASVAVPEVLADDGNLQIVSVPFPAGSSGGGSRYFRLSVGLSP